jgi:hypothetical protein
MGPLSNRLATSGDSPRVLQAVAQGAQALDVGKPGGLVSGDYKQEPPVWESGAEVSNTEKPGGWVVDADKPEAPVSGAAATENAEGKTQRPPVLEVKVKKCSLANKES